MAKEKKKKRTKYAVRFLTCGMIRNSDDDSPHICAFCRKRFNLKASHNLLQCPTCKDVYHLQCMLDFIRKSSNDTITCPSCREIVPVQSSDDYISTDALENEWHFDFDEVVTNKTDKEFRQNVDDSEKDDNDVDSGSEEGSDEGSEEGSEGSEEGREVSEEGSDSSSSDDNAEDEESDSDSDDHSE